MKLLRDPAFPNNTKRIAEFVRLGHGRKRNFYNKLKLLKGNGKRAALLQTPTEVCKSADISVPQQKPQETTFVPPPIATKPNRLRVISPKRNLTLILSLSRQAHHPRHPRSKTRRRTASPKKLMPIFTTLLVELLGTDPHLDLVEILEWLYAKGYHRLSRARTCGSLFKTALPF